ncbi:family 43 glycosylhydrolase [Rufibacter psychrotolerans]|uniref:family 43 glycosylhydrolase n=1 Tax=Rufibacter psychrotolerans TaxID=2812556 RepID=UPI001967D856|nr:family 43 glycosylhydrolase [Rufibacter sp. SYSU D00308]
MPAKPTPASVLYMLLLTGAVVLGPRHAAQAQLGNIKNDRFWNTKDGQPIYSQGGGIFRFPDPVTGAVKYFWYGVQYEEAALYRENPSVTLPTSTFKSVTCYTSTDLVNWKAEGDVLTKSNIADPWRQTWVGRLGVAYVREVNQYAMFVQYGSRVLVALADSPVGPFKRHQEINMEPMIGTTNTGDQTVFTDEDTGKSYLVYSYGKGRHKIYVSEIGVKDGKVTLLDCTQIFKGAGREGNCMFKYQGKYYMAASDLYGWDSSHAYYLVADDIRGPYLPTDKMLVMNGVTDDFSHVTQTGFFVTVKGSKQETVVYCGDRWADFAGNGLGYNQWVPLSFEGSTPHFNSLHSWNLNEKTGKWEVAKDNNYVKNGSFEADRRAIPSPVKPVQEQLTGWATMVLAGNKLEVGAADSPVLNHMNTESERKEVIGEKSLQLSDKVAFKRKTFQVIASSPYVTLEDGRYTLTAKVKNSGGFAKLEMYAQSNGKLVQHSIQEENATWKTIQLKDISVKGGKVEIGFVADGQAHAFCYVDDVALVRTR